MNCKTCNTTIDYNFLSNCSVCGSEVGPESLLKPREAHPAAVPPTPVKRSSGGRHVVNFFSVVVTSLVGMVSGAVVVYFSAGMILMAVFSSAGNPSESCARGMAIGFFSIISGAYLGIVGGTLYAAKHFVVKPTAD